MRRVAINMRRYKATFTLGRVLNLIDDHLKGLNMAKFCQTASNS